VAKLKRRSDMRIDVYHHFYKDDVSEKLDEILIILESIQRKEAHMSKELDELQAAVEENTVLDGSIIELVNGLAAQILDLKDDPAKLAALAASLKTSSSAIAAAIQANTPVAPE